MKVQKKGVVETYRDDMSHEVVEKFDVWFGNEKQQYKNGF